MTLQSIIELTTLAVMIISGGVSVGMIKQRLKSLELKECPNPQILTEVNNLKDDKEQITRDLGRVWDEINTNKVNDMKVITKLETIEVEIQQLRAENNDRAEQQNKITGSLISMINNNIGAKNA